MWLEYKENNIFLRNMKIKIPNYTILGELGQGVNGKVFKAYSHRLEKEVAIKTWVNYKNIKNKNIKKRLNEEIFKMAKLDHRNIVHIYFADEIIVENDTIYYVVMEYIDGLRIKEVIPVESNHPIKDGEKLHVTYNKTERIKILLKILAALRYSHEKGCFHGDMHLENILIDEKKEVKLIDFGSSINNKKYSKYIDSKILRETCLAILGTKNKKIISDEFYKINDPQNIRIIMKYFLKMDSLLEMLEFGFIDTVVEDILRFSTVTPFFKPRVLMKIIFKTIKKENLKIELMKYYIREIASRYRWIIRNEYTFITCEKINIDIIDEYYNKLYNAYRKRFISKRFFKEIEIYSSMDEIDELHRNLYSEKWEDNNLQLKEKKLLEIECRV